MTTPNQGPPDGAVTVGGGGWRYGQMVNERRARQTFEIEAPSNLSEALDMLPFALAQLPSTSFKPFQKWLNLSDEDVANGSIRQKIIDALSKHPLRKLIDGLFDGFKGTTGSDGKTPEDIAAAAAELAAKTSTAVTNADMAVSNAQLANDLAGDIVASGANLVVNGDFERGITSQPLQGVFSTDIPAFWGTKTLKMVGNGTTTKSYDLMFDGITPRTVSASQGTVFYVEAYIWGAASNVQTSGGSTGVRFAVNPKTRLGANLADAYVAVTANTSLKGVWTKIAGYVTMPANTAKVSFSLQLTNAVNNNETYYWDYVTVQEVTLAKQANDTAVGAAASATTANTNATNATSVAGAAQTTANTANTTANTANTNTQAAIDNLHQSIQGGTSTGNTPASVKTNLRTAWAAFWDGLGGTTGATDKLPGDVRTRASLLNTKAITADTNATAGLSNGQATVDYIYQGINGGTSTGNTIPSVKTGLQAAWSNLFDGLGGTSGSSGKTAAEVKPIATALKALAGTADTKATGAQSTADGVNTNHGTLVNNIITAFFGESSMTGNLADALAAMRKNYSDVSDNTKAIQALQVRRDATVSKGWTYNVDFSNFSTVAAAGFTMSYTGTGASTVGVSGGVAQWTVADNNPRDAILVYNQETATDFQSVRGTMAAPPQVPNGTTPYFYAILRRSADGLSYVWARAYAVSLGVYRADMGYAVGGVQYTWVTGIPLKWSLDMRFVAGNGTATREYQIWSGNAVVWSHIESGTASMVGPNNRRWGAIAQVRNGRVAGKVSSVSASDNGTPAVTGSTARMVRTSSAVATFEGGNVGKAFPASFFDTASYESLDVDALPAYNAFRVLTAKPYIITARVALSASVATLAHLMLQTSMDGVNWTTVQYGNSVYPNNGEALSGTWIQYLNALQYVRVAYIRTGINVNALTGESSGSQTFFSIASAEGTGL